MAIDKIGSKALVDCSVAAADIAPGTITAAKLAGSITNAKLANSSVTINGTSIALGASASIDPIAWQSVVVSDGSTVTTMVAGRGYFVNNTSAAGIVKLPASASAGDTIAIKDYAGNFGTNNLTIQRNSHNIQGVANDSVIQTNRASLILVYVDATKGWLYTNESNVADLEEKLYTSATGGTITNSGNFRIHTFTGDGNFVVSSAGNPAGGGAKVSYVVVAGGGGGAKGCRVGGGGAGGFREGKNSPVDSYTASPLAASDSGLTVSAQTYPITVGAGGAAGSSGPFVPGISGSPSTFSTITAAAGGGGGGGPNPGTGGVGLAGGSGGGGAHYGSAGGAGNTPPVSPPQGNNGGNGQTGSNAGSGGGGGAGAVGGNGCNSIPGQGGPGGAGVSSEITASSVARAGGGGGGGDSGTKPGGTGGGGASGHPGTAGTANTGGGGGGTIDGGACRVGGAGGKGVVIIRYKYQN